MTINSQDIKKVAHLAKLAVDEAQTNALTDTLTNILCMVNELDSAPVQNVAPMAHPYDAPQPMRDDVVTETNQRAALQSIAPQVQLGLYIVPPVIE